MFKYKLLIFTILSIFQLQGCTQILEPVLLQINERKNLSNAQEEFNINIDTLTFENAKEANNDPYPRELMIMGNGDRANLFNENEFLKANIPEHLHIDDYRLGLKDELSFNLISQFKTEPVKWPDTLGVAEYVLGVGDELTFTQLTNLSAENSLVNEIGPLRSKNDNKVITTVGKIGSNGEILLLGIGKLKAKGKTLDALQNEARNILIRNGSAPNFQLEISLFNSQKVYVIIERNGIINSILENVMNLDNIPKSLQEIAHMSGIVQSSGNTVLVTLTRDGIEYRATAGQLFDPAYPEVFIHDNDVINIIIQSKKLVQSQTSVGPTGAILLPNIGKINALNRTLSEVSHEIQDILDKQMLVANFQLELTAFKSKKVYFFQKNVGSKVISLSNNKETLKDIIIEHANTSTQNNSLFVVTLRRDKENYQLPLSKVLDQRTPQIWIQNNDQIEIENIKYKKGQVYALSGAGKSEIIYIEPSKRETLANVLFMPSGAFNNLNAKRSEVYLLRGRNPAVAYHLDAQNVSRILIAAKTELRPDDIIYIAERPIISFTRVLAELTPLRILLRDIENGKIP